VLLVACFLICVASVPLAGGRLGALADLRVERAWALSVALVIQIAVMSVWPEGDRAVRAGAHLVSYGLILLFLAANRRLPGLWLVALGTALNLAAIAANGGVMPAAEPALEAAGLLSAEGRFANSARVADAHLSFLGDVFAWPAPLPLANVFSVGDVAIVVGAAIVLHRVCGSRLALRGGPPRASAPGSGQEPVGS
jgi:hypothetical protein